MALALEATLPSEPAMRHQIGTKTSYNPKTLPDSCPERDRIGPRSTPHGRLGSLRRRDDNSRSKVQNVGKDSSVGLHDLQAGAPTRPAARQQDPQPSVGALQTQARRRALVEHGQLVTKGENLSLQRGTVAKTGGEESEKSNQNRIHRGRNHHPTNEVTS